MTGILCGTADAGRVDQASGLIRGSPVAQGFNLGLSIAAGRGTLRWTPVFGRLDKVDLRGWEAPYQEQDDGWDATSIWVADRLSGITSRPGRRPRTRS